MSHEPGEMVEILRQQVSKVLTTAQDRRDREMRGVHHIDRRGMRTPPEHIRDKQLNIKVSSRFRQRISAYAVAHKLSVTEVLVRAFDAYAARDKE